MFKVTVQPKFNTTELINHTLKKDWFEFQQRAFEIGKIMTRYMQSYISTNRKRSGGTGRLSNAIRFYGKVSTGRIEWGIGLISSLNRIAPYWYVLNYGKKITGEPFIPPANVGHFEGEAPDSSLVGRGTQKWTNANINAATGERLAYYMKPKVPIRPINYIESTKFQVDLTINTLLTNFSRG